MRRLTCCRMRGSESVMNLEGCGRKWPWIKTSKVDAAMLNFSYFVIFIKGFKTKLICVPIMVLVYQHLNMSMTSGFCRERLKKIFSVRCDFSYIARTVLIIWPMNIILLKNT